MPVRLLRAGPGSRAGRRSAPAARRPRAAAARARAPRRAERARSPVQRARGLRAGPVVADRGQRRQTLFALVPADLTRIAERGQALDLALALDARGMVLG